MAREGLLVNAGDDTIHVPGEDGMKPKTPKKKFENFWYYHKWHLIVAVIAAALVFVVVRDIAGKVDPDYQIALLSERLYTTEFMESLQDRIQEYADDRNGDGQIVVRVSNYMINNLDEGMDPTGQAAGQMQLMADVSVGQSMIFITEDAPFLEEQESSGMFAYLDGSLPPENATDYENMRAPLEECRAFEGLKLPEGLGISLRIYVGSQIEGPKLENYAKSSAALLNRLRNGEKPVQPARQQETNENMEEEQ